jgi:hypothetical protein
MKKEKRDKKEEGGKRIKEERLYPISEEKFMEVVLPLRAGGIGGKAVGLKFSNIKRFEVCSII